MHHLKHAITVANPIYADIYCIDHDPAIVSDYSYNPYEFTRM
ncbi:MAG: hypothetical protein WA317_11845 [Mycobacterium sp.]